MCPAFTTTAEDRDFQALRRARPAVRRATDMLTVVAPERAQNVQFGLASRTAARAREAWTPAGQPRRALPPAASTRRASVRRGRSERGAAARRRQAGPHGARVWQVEDLHADHHVSGRALGAATAPQELVSRTFCTPQRASVRTGSCSSLRSKPS